MRLVLGFFLLAGPLVAESTRAKDLTVEYRRNGAGELTAFVRNKHSTAATAYLVQVAYKEAGRFRERHTAFGGDTLGFSNGNSEDLAAGQETDTGRAMPRGSEPTANYVIAAIYADGFTEGDDEVVQMLLSGRHRAYADLQEAIPMLEKSGRKEEALARLAAMQERDQAEGAKLDQLLDVPGMRYRFFMSAVPAQGLQMLQSGEASAVLAEFQKWKARLATSKPDVR